MKHPPRAGEEQWVAGGQVMPGGAANQATACTRLGLNTTLITEVGADAAGTLVRQLLESESVAIAGSQREAQNITVALSLDGDRAFISSGTPKLPRLPRLPAPNFLMCSLPYLAANRQAIAEWRDSGTVVIADAAWDETGNWDPQDLDCLATADYFVPNHVEAMNYTRTASPQEAARKLSELVPAVVVTCGESGLHARVAGTEFFLPAPQVSAVDATGAGDAFTAGLAAGIAYGASPEDALRLGQWVAALVVQRVGGSLNAPTLAEVLEWAAARPDCAPAAARLATLPCS